MSSEPKKETIKIELDNKPLCTKKYFLNQNLSELRENLKSKIGNANFTNKGESIIEIEDENDFTLGEIIKDNKLIFKSSENNNSNGIKIIINGIYFSTKQISLETNLKSFRDILKNEIKGNFLFLDKEEVEVEQDGEEDFQIKEIINNDEIRIKSNNPPIKQNNQSTFNEVLINNQDKNQESKIKIEENKIKFDLSKYEVIKKNYDVTLYRYSKMERTSNHELVYHYHFDTFDSNDYRKAYIVLFVGKTGDGKSTGINAFFNVIKGIQLKENYRFILIEEKEKTAGESVTDGVHLYYLRDYNNEPVIIIDSQGYGDTRGREYDEKINSAFEHVFSSVIDHINTVCFIANATHSRLDILTKYIFVSVTSLFSEDISENLLILATHANKDTMKNGPVFISTISSDEAFQYINKKMDEKFWYASDNKLIFDNDMEKLAVYSYNQLLSLYTEKVKKLKPKGVKNCANVLTLRSTLTKELNRLKEKFTTLLNENSNLKIKQKSIDEKKEKLIQLNAERKTKEEHMATLKGKQLENFLRTFNDDLEAKLAELKNQKIPQKRKVLKANSNNKYTICRECQRNCHDPCDCWFKFVFKRCTIYPVFSNDCEECGHNKCVHECGYNYYDWETEEVNIDNSKLAEEVKLNTSKQENYIRQQIDDNNKEKDKIQEYLNKVRDKINQLENELYLVNNEKTSIEKKINDIQKDISITLFKLQSYNDKLNTICMIRETGKTQNEYYKSLKEKMKAAGVKDEKQEKYLNKLIKENKNIENINSLKSDDILALSSSEDKLKEILDFEEDN